MKVRSFFAAAAWLLLLPLCLNAQLSAPDSRWVAGIGFGFSATPYSVQGEREGNLIPVETTLEYRLSRRLSLTARISYGQLHTTNVRTGITPEDVYAFLNTYRVQTATALIAPQVQFRLWQGDLSIALGLGQYRQWYDQKSYGVASRQYVIKYQGVDNEFFSFRAGYTYWPHQRFGVAIELEATDSFGGPGRNAFPEPRQPSANTMEPLGIFEELQPRARGYSTTTIWMGFRYRF